MNEKWRKREKNYWRKVFVFFFQCLSFPNLFHWFPLFIWFFSPNLTQFHFFSFSIFIRRFSLNNYFRHFSWKWRVSLSKILATKTTNNLKENQSEKSETNTKKMKPYFLFWFFSFFFLFFTISTKNAKKCFLKNVIYLSSVFSNIRGIYRKKSGKCSFLKKRIFKW